jgi:hypothetical protein
MVVYECQRCNKKFDRKNDLDRHLARKKYCIKKSGSKTNKIVFDPSCKACGKSFSRRDSLNRHVKICKKNKNSKISKNSNSNGNNNNNNNPLLTGNKSNIFNGDKNTAINGDIKINNIENVNLVFFGTDNIECLIFNDLVKLVKSNKNLYEALITTINFNPKKPEHHNVYYPDLKGTYGKVYENKKWVNKKINEIINIILDLRTEDLKSIVENFGSALSKKAKENIIKTIEDADYSKLEQRKKLISYIKPILYNNKDIVLETRKLIKQINSRK